MPLPICPFRREKCRQLRKLTDRDREFRQPANRGSILDNFSGFSDTSPAAGDITSESGIGPQLFYLSLPSKRFSPSGAPAASVSAHLCRNHGKSTGRAYLSITVWWTQRVQDS